MRSIRIKLTIAIFLLPILTCAQTGPVLQAGTLTMSGEVFIPADLKEDSVWLFITIGQPFTGRHKQYKTLVQSNGRFTLKVNTETNLGICAISTSVNREHWVTAPLKKGGENKVTFSYNDEGAINKIKVNGQPAFANQPQEGMVNQLNAGDLPEFTEADMLQGLARFNELLAHKSNKPRPTLYDRSFTEFINFTKNVFYERWTILNQSPLSGSMKQLVFRDYLLAMYYTHIFDYQGEMQLNYRNTNNQQKPDSSKIQTPDRQYFSFLKELNLNNPQYLYAHSFPAFTQELLTNNILNIPRIRDTPVDEWVRNTKQILAPLLGFDQGMFYDMLIGNAYGLQFEVEVQPLSPTQIDNIKKYYKGSDLEKLLLRRNQEVIQTALSKNKLVINDTPGVPAEALMNAIIARYKGKTVIVDFWATWCIPCLEAIKDSRALKMRLVDNDATFIYITNPSSPKKLWKERIQGIGGEHYYLTSKEWTYLYEHYKFEGVPSYLIFDKKGVLKHHFTGYPGNDVLQKIINEAD